MRKSKFTDSQIMDAVNALRLVLACLIFAENWVSALPPFTNGEPNMAVWTFQ